MIGHLLTRTCAIARTGDRTPDSDGVVRESFSDVATEVPYARQTKAGKYTSPDGRREIEFVATAYFEFGVDLKPGLPDNAERDMITDEADGAVFYVAALVDQTGLEEFLVAYLTTE